MTEKDKLLSHIKFNFELFSYCLEHKIAYSVGYILLKCIFDFTDDIKKVVENDK